MPGATSTASCAGVPSGAGWSSSTGWRWPTPPSSVAGSSAAPGPTIAGKAVLAAAHERLLAQALSTRTSEEFLEGLQGLQPTPARTSAASRNVRPVAVLLAVVTGCPVIRFVLLPERFVLLPERFGIQLPGALRSPQSRSRKVTAPKALQRHGRCLVQFLGAAVRFKLMRLRFGSTLPCSRHSVRLVQCRCSLRRSWLSSLRQPPQDEQGEGCLKEH